MIIEGRACDVCGRFGTTEVIEHTLTTPTATLKADLCDACALPAVNVFVSVGRSQAGGALHGADWLAKVRLNVGKITDHGRPDADVDPQASRRVARPAGRRRTSARDGDSP